MTRLPLDRVNGNNGVLEMTSRRSGDDWRSGTMAGGYGAVQELKRLNDLLGRSGGMRQVQYCAMVNRDGLGFVLLLLVRSSDSWAVTAASEFRQINRFGQVLLKLPIFEWWKPTKWQKWVNEGTDWATIWNIWRDQIFLAISNQGSDGCPILSLVGQNCRYYTIVRTVKNPFSCPFSGPPPKPRAGSGAERTQHEDAASD